MLQALIFDVDGTLADTENVHRVAFNRAFATAGLDWHWDQERYGGLLKVAGGKERIAHFIDTERLGTVAPQDLDALVAKLHDAKTKIYERLVERGSLKLRPGVAPLIEAAGEGGVRLAIATTTTARNVTALLRATLGEGGAGLFEVIAAGDCVRQKKPAPDIYLHVLEKLQLPVASCLAVEDSRNGMRAALGAGLAVVVTPSRYTATEDFTGAAKVFETLEEKTRSAASAASRGQAILRALRSIHAAAIQPAV